MRRIATAAALAMFAVSLSFGDDANVLPGGVARLRLIPSYSTTEKTYDNGGKLVDTAAEGTVTTLSSAFEFGVTSAITLGLKWAPGYYAASSLTNAVEVSTFTSKKGKVSGLDDLELGAKLQILGKDGFIPNSMLRLALTPGVSVPLDKYDAAKEFENYVKGKEFRPQTSSGHGSLGYGLKADLDYLVTEMFYINVHGQALQYNPSEALTFKDYAPWGATYWGYINAGQTDTVAKGAADASYDGHDTDKRTNTYGTEYLFEVEPHYTIDLGQGSNLGIGVPITYTLNAAGESKYQGTTTKDKGSSLTVAKPYLSYFVLLAGIPLEIQGEYDLPLMGKDSLNTGTFQLQLKLFYKFY